MKIEIDIPDYDGNALDVIWNNDSIVEPYCVDKQIVIKANSEGLISLAKQMVYLAVNRVARGSHIHYDSFLLGNNKYELVIEKAER